MAESRKVQTIRGSTHLISLPKKWVDRLGIHAGTPLSMRLLPDGSILLVPPGDRPGADLHCNLRVDVAAPDQVARAIIGAYLAGNKTIRVQASGGSAEQMALAVRDACDRVRGLVVVEQGTDHVVLQDLLDPKDFNARKGIQRLHQEARHMLLDACRNVTGQEGAPTLEALERRDDELDRMLFVLVKQQNLLMRDLSFSDKVGIPLEESLDHLLVAQYLERIGDYAVRIARHHPLGPRLRAEPQQGRVMGTCDLAVKALDDAVAAFQRRDVALAQSTVALALNVGRLASTIPLELVQSKDRKTVLPTCQACLAFCNIYESLERVGLYAKSIAEVAINHALSAPAPKPGQGGTNP